MKPTWFLDIDGVINVIPAKHGNPNKLPHLRIWNTWESLYITTTDVAGSPNPVGKTLPILYSPQLIDHINRLSANIDIKWLTTWHKNAIVDFAPQVGLKDFPLADYANGVFDGWGQQATVKREQRWWKLNTITDFMLKQHDDSVQTHIIWTDDDIRKPARQYVRSLAKDLDQGILPITPFDSKSLEPAHIQKIEAVLEK